MKTMAAEAQLDRKFTNHSLRAYGVTKLFKENVPEKLIMDRSGHRTVDGVRQYERVSDQQQFEVCRTLESKANTQIAPYRTSQPETCSGISTMQQKTLQQCPVHQPAMFQGCTFSNYCTIQLAAPPPVKQYIADDYSDLDIKELLDF